MEPAQAQAPGTARTNGNSQADTMPSPDAMEIQYHMVHPTDLHMDDDGPPQVPQDLGKLPDADSPPVIPVVETLYDLWIAWKETPADYPTDIHRLFFNFWNLMDPQFQAMYKMRIFIRDIKEEQWCDTQEYESLKQAVLLRHPRPPWDELEELRLGLLHFLGAPLEELATSHCGYTKLWWLVGQLQAAKLGLAIFTNTLASKWPTYHQDVIGAELQMHTVWPNPVLHVALAMLHLKKHRPKPMDWSPDKLYLSAISTLPFDLLQLIDQAGERQNHYFLALRSLVLQTRPLSSTLAWQPSPRHRVCASSTGMAGYVCQHCTPLPSQHVAQGKSQTLPMCGLQSRHRNPCCHLLA